MNYRFTTIRVGDFNANKAEPLIGDVHLKRFLPGVTPINQATLNLYAGTFEFSIPTKGFHQILHPGQSSLDISVEEFPAGEICNETPVANGGIRYCIEPVAKGCRWKRYRQAVSGELQLVPGSAVFVIDGDVLVDGTQVEYHVPVGCQVLKGTGTVIVMEIA